MSVLQPIPLNYPSRKAALANIVADGPLVYLFAPTKVVRIPGADVRFDIGFTDSDRRFDLTGTVVQRKLGITPGLQVAFKGEQKKLCAQMAAFCADRPLELGTSTAKRYPCRLVCSIQVAEGTYEGQVLDLSSSGAFVSSSLAKRLRPGTQLKIHIAPRLFGLLGPKLSSHVIWCGEKAGRSGFGIHFHGEAATLRRALDSYLHS